MPGAPSAKARNFCPLAPLRLVRRLHDHVSYGCRRLGLWRDMAGAWRYQYLNRAAYSSWVVAPVNVIGEIIVGRHCRQQTVVSVKSHVAISPHQLTRRTTAAAPSAMP